MKKSVLFTVLLFCLSLAVLFVGCETNGDINMSEISFVNTDFSASVSADTSASADTSFVSPEVSEEISEEASAEMSAEMSEEVSVEVSSETSQEVSEEVSEDVSEEVSYPEQERTAIVTYDAPSKGSTYTGLPVLEQIEYSLRDADNLRGLDTTRIDHMYGVAKDGKPHNITVQNQQRFDKYGTNALTWDNKTDEKVLYLTFDCGYKYEDLIDRILDTLNEKDVPAAFFCTISYLKSDPDDITRMINEGHIVGNHSVTHPSDSSVLSREKLAWELLGVENYLRENFGYSSKYFRFPCGVYSESALDVVDNVGYRSIFWSIAHADWDPANQPGVDVSFQTVTSRLHPGAVILLHSTSPDNADILADFIDYCRAEGYTFRSLDEYEYWN